MKLLEGIRKILVRGERTLLVVLVIVMVVLAFLQVFLRNVFSLGLLWGDPFLRYVVMWVGFLGAMQATDEEKHFGVDLLNRFLSTRVIHVVKIIIDAFACVVAFLLARAAFQFLFDAIGAEEKDLFDLPRRAYFAVIPIGFGVIAVHYFINMILHARTAVAKTTEPGKPGASQSILQR